MKKLMIDENSLNDLAPPVAFYICPEKKGVKKKKDSHISVRLLCPYLEKQVFQTQKKPLPVMIPPTLIRDEFMLEMPSLAKTRYVCPNCETGDLVLDYEHEGDCRNDYLIYDCCQPCMLLCPEYCGGLPKYRICTLCKTEFFWEQT